MHLKRLDLVGFKTFAEKTSLEFSSRITAIVGPNGSGKSNIFDAIRWALGEGSLRNLRGVRTEDVIFAGSERRRPLGMAEVVLTLDNIDSSLMLPAGSSGRTDGNGDGNGDGRGHGRGPAATPLAFSEVTVTRRGMRAADSQYFVNGLPCRLRDIQTMFLGTGLGGHSYALITQGEVDHLLDASPEERRMILEEAAGLAKFKRRRRDAERRMAAADQLLLRVADLVGELDAHCTQLAAQAEAARTYQAYTQELRTLEVSVQVEEVRRLTRSQRRLREQMEQIAARRREVEETLRALAGDREALDRRAADAGRQWDDGQRALVDLTERRSATEAERQLLAERRRSVDAQRERLARDLERVQGERDGLDRERAALAEAEGTLAADRDRVRAEVRDAEGALLRLDTEAAALEARVDAGREEAQRLAGARARVAGEMTAAAERAAAARDRAAAARERMTHLAERRGMLEAERRAGADDEARAGAALEQARSDLASLTAERRDTAAAREALLEDLRRVEIEREGVRQHLRYLEDADAQLRGYDAGARDLLLARRRDPARFAALRAAIADLVQVSADLRTAVEEALGFSLSALIVDSVEAMHAVLAQLSDRDLGRVTFLPLTLLSGGDPLPVPPPVASDPAVIGRAADLVRVADGHREHHAAVRALLRDVLIVRDLSAALRVRAAGYAGRIVTLAGEGVWPQGALTTGRPGAGQRGVVGRPEEIEEARASLARLDRAAEDVVRRGEALAARLRQADASAAAAAERVAHQGDARADIARRLTLLDAEIARLAEEAGALAAEQQAAEAEEASHGALRERFAAEAAALDARLADGEAEIRRLAGQLREQTGSRRNAAQAVTDLKVTLTELAARGEALRARTAASELALAQCRLRHDDLSGEDRELLAAAAGLEAEQHAAGTRCEALAREAADLRQSLASLDAERAHLAARRAEIETAHADAAGRAEALADEVHRVELRQAQVDAEIGSAHRRMEEEFGRAYDQLAGGVPEAVDRDEALGRIEALRGLIAAMGAVNLLAIEEHRQVAARLEALRAQRDDVQGTVAALRALITRLEGIIRERFDDTYRAVNEEFSALFVRLFDGGRAGLDLVPIEGSDEPGVDIIVQPPGKNLRSLGALSGGERVLVSLALIFAMLRVRPSPFCVFDEVEAALDETNTRKVSQILQELAAETQIIIITHNKATMEACDVMFGVTMEEPGVSHMVSMRLQDRDRLGETQPVA